MTLRRDLLERSKQMRSRERSNIFNLAAILLVLLLVLFVAVMRRPELRVSEIDVDGTEVVDSVQVEQLVQEHLGRYWLWVIPRSNKLYIPKDDISKEILGTFPQVSTVNVSAGLSPVLRVVVGEYKPKYLSCMEEECHFLTTDGFRYAPAPNFQDTQYLIFSGGTSTLRAHIIDPVEFTELTSALDQLVLPLEEDRLRSVDITEDHDYIAHTHQGYEIRWDDDLSGSHLVERLELVYGSDSFAQRLEDDPDTLEYIDARFGKKVFYKFTDQEEVEDEG